MSIDTETRDEVKMTRLLSESRPRASDAKPTLLIVGRPNSGKTSVFNRLTGSRLKTGNYHGVTVEHAEGKLTLHDGTEARLIDLPGTPSLIPNSPDEGLTADALWHDTLGVYEAVIVVVDALRLIEGLYMGLQVIELGAPTLIVINQLDLAERAGVTLDLERIKRDLSGGQVCAELHIVGVSAHTGLGFTDLGEALSRISQVARSTQNLSEASEVSTSAHISSAVHPWGRCDLHAWLESEPELARELVRAVDTQRLSAYLPWALLAAAEGEAPLSPNLRLHMLRAVQEPRGVTARNAAESMIESRFHWLDHHAPQWCEWGARQTRASGNALDSTDPNFDSNIDADSALRSSLHPDLDPNLRAERIDRWLLHPLWGALTFIGVMLVLFQALFVGADPFIGMIERAVEWLGGLASAHLPEHIVSEFIIEGLINGVGNVVVFLPQVLILFGLIGLMESCGYMARAAALTDRVMRAAGLSGRAFVPMLSGFICAVPAILATRTLPQRRDRLLTMMALPLLACSARLPVYTLLITTLLPAQPWILGIDQRAWVMVALYLFSALSAFAAVWVMGRTILKGEAPPLMLHLPVYRRPVLRDVFRELGARSWVFIKEAGTVILAGTIVLWLLLSFPRGDENMSSEINHVEIEQASGLAQEPSAQEPSAQEPPAQEPSAQEPSATSSPHLATPLSHEARLAARRAQSYGGQLGRLIEPLLRPLGWDWQVGVGLIGAFAAREVFISTLGMVYGVGGEVNEESASLRERIKAARHSDGTPVFTPISALALLIFFSLACQCLSTLAAVKRETGGYRWPLFMFSYMSLLAYGCALLVTWIGGALTS